MIKILKNMGKKEWGLFLLSLCQVLLVVYLDLKQPEYMSNITKLVKTPDSDMAEIWANGKMMLICALASIALSIVGRFISSILAATFSYNLRAKVFKRVEDFSMEEIEKFSTASLITRTTNDVQEMQHFIARGLQMIVRAPIMVIYVIYKIYDREWEWLSITIISVCVVLMSVVIILKYVRPRFRMRQTLTDNLNRVMRENMTGIRIVRAYNAEDYQKGKFEEANKKLTSNTLFARRAMALMHPITRLNHDILDMGIYLVGAKLIAAAASPAIQLDLFSEMVVFNSYASKLLQSFMSLEMIFSMLPRATVSAERINEVLDTEPIITDGDKTKGLEKGTVEFRNVAFRYSDGEADVIKNISFKANPGETVAFIGATGSGKSTLVNLIPRMHDATEGEVLVDGINVKEYTQEALHNLIGYSSQRATLFTGTVNTNVDYGDNGRTPDEQMDVKKAVEIAQAKDFVENLDGQYDAFIARGGSNLSGGQKQRLSVARTVFKKPEIYVFDDTFSALDYRTDKNLRKALKEETAGTTTLIVAQRIGTIRDADKIIVLDEGQIVGMGTHKELLQNCQVYKEIAMTQLSQEELA
ncbi:MAG: ABC transporter ATP-binding protein [Erysipelotrichaceae bacterium]|nr:ABC transporter ATP-binding protein [Erysipelotrichaceae bacterium]